MRTGQESRGKRVLAYVLLATMLIGICVGCSVLAETISRFGQIYQLQADPGVEGRNPPYDRPLVDGDTLRLVEKDRFRLDFWRLEIANGDSVLIAHPGQPIALRIYYPGYVKAVDGRWRGEKASVNVLGGLEMELIGQPGNPDVHWGTTLPGGLESITPYFDVSLPIQKVDLTAPWEQRILQINTQFLVDYPKSLSGPGFTNSWISIKHEFELVVLAPEEMEEYRAIRNKERLGRGVPLLLGGIALGLLLLAAATILPVKIADKWKVDISSVFESRKAKMKR